MRCPTRNFETWARALIDPSLMNVWYPVAKDTISNDLTHPSNGSPSA
jgi:hypothetical protein